jgi:hypothetical protein
MRAARRFVQPRQQLRREAAQLIHALCARQFNTFGQQRLGFAHVVALVRQRFDHLDVGNFWRARAGHSCVPEEQDQVVAGREDGFAGIPLAGMNATVARHGGQTQVTVDLPGAARGG